MTLSKTALRTNAPGRSRRTGRVIDRQARHPARPAIQNDSIVVDSRLLDEVRDWAILAAASAVAWTSAAIAIGVV